MRAVAHCAEGMDVGLGEVDAHGEAVFELGRHVVRDHQSDVMVEGGVARVEGDVGGCEGF